MGGSCSTYWRQKELHTGFLWGGLRERDHLEDLGVSAIVNNVVNLISFFKTLVTTSSTTILTSKNATDSISLS